MGLDEESRIISPIPAPHLFEMLQTFVPCGLLVLWKKWVYLPLPAAWAPKQGVLFEWYQYWGVLRWRVLGVSWGRVRNPSQQSKSKLMIWSGLSWCCQPEVRIDEGQGLEIRTESKWDVDGFKNLRDGHQHLGKFKWGCVYPLRLPGSDPEHEVLDTGIN